MKHNRSQFLTLFNYYGGKNLRHETDCSYFTKQMIICPLSQYFLYRSLWQLVYHANLIISMFSPQFVFNQVQDTKANSEEIPKNSKFVRNNA